jgi:hypothetical protein
LSSAAPSLAEIHLSSMVMKKLSVMVFGVGEYREIE